MEISVDTSLLSEKTEDWIAQFDVVVATELTYSELVSTVIFVKSLFC